MTPIPDILAKIVEHKKQEVVECRRHTPEETLARMARTRPKPRRFRNRLHPSGSPDATIIAEIKRASPSKGPIRPDLDPAALAREYEHGGAAALSVLTDVRHFKAGPDDLPTARAACALPVLRKDFIIDTYQIYESAALGADAILLIAGALTPRFLRQALDLCRALELDALVEVHTKAELDRASDAGADLLGINNRDLKTFAVDIRTTLRLSRHITRDQIAVCESGITDRSDIQTIMDAGVFNFLIGETLLRSPNPSQTLRELLGTPTERKEFL